MKFRLKNRSQMPPSGWYYRQPETGWVLPDPMNYDFASAAREIQKHRANNPGHGLNVSMDSCMTDLEAFTCLRLNGDPDWCISEDEEAKKKLLSTSRTRQDMAVGASRAVGSFDRAAHVRTAQQGNVVPTNQNGRPVTNTFDLGIADGFPPFPVNYALTCFICLGRYGDIFNALPILKRHFDTTGEKPTLIISKEFEQASNWANYYNAMIWDGPYDLVKPAIAWAEARFSKVVPLQPCSRDFEANHECQSFTQEMWRMAGMLPLWGLLPTIVDGRSPHRELKLAGKFGVEHCGCVLFGGSSHSSPLAASSELLTAIKTAYGSSYVIDLSWIKDGGIIDVLGLMERAVLLVSIDTVWLHMAAASKVPVVELITETPTPWNGSKTRCNTVASFKYSEVQKAKEFIQRFLQQEFVHCYSERRKVGLYDKDCSKTWPGFWEDCPYPDDRKRRNIAGRPYFKDIVESAVSSRKNGCIIYTNRDTWIASDANTVIMAELAKSGPESCLYAFRRDIQFPKGVMSRADVLRYGTPYDGIDLFAFTVEWWRKYEKDMPDCVIGAPEWDRALRRLMEATSTHSPGVDGLIYHVWHDPVYLEAGQSELCNVNGPAVQAQVVPRMPRKSKGDVDAILAHYRARPVIPKPACPDLSKVCLSNNALGIGDALILSPVSALSTAQGQYVHTWQPSKTFADLFRFVPGWKPYDNRPTVSADLLCNTVDLGGGHFIQRVLRAAGVKAVPAVPRPNLLIPDAKRVRGRCMLHLEAGPEAGWQRDHLHFRAREVYLRNRCVIEDFVRRNERYLEFHEVGRRTSGLNGVKDRTGRALEDTVRFAATCEWFLGIVSGPMHIAAAFGLKSVVIVNFPSANRIYLPTLRDISQVESEWLYPQNCHLHQDGEGELVKAFNIRNLELAFEGALYPYWSEEYCQLINEKV